MKALSVTNNLQDTSNKYANPYKTKKTTRRHPKVDRHRSSCEPLPQPQPQVRHTATSRRPLNHAIHPRPVPSAAGPNDKELYHSCPNRVPPLTPRPSPSPFRPPSLPSLPPCTARGPWSRAREKDVPRPARSSSPRTAATNLIPVLILSPVGDSLPPGGD